ncbi:LysE family translocator [Roseibium marinum]|uniref:Threonine/homoserine/homoserine lactone efflux protein n=1 Tax=Roseibium marinum TaxID=281252 RepID=A0A2S3UY13_9HYPH|nr:LysE family translocator [Roseibium marinum]POF32413.1 threonine/homoserine/homoserine lactone efflux protein [Roseibium marinum]
MSEDLASLFLALGIFLVGFVSIGPNILAIVGTSMERGRHSGMRLALGVGTGSGLWAILTVSGLTALVSAYAQAVTVLKVFGAFYLLWLAVKAFRSAARPGEVVTARSAKGNNLFLQGLAIQMTNPKAALHWIAIVGIGLGADAPLWTGATLILSCSALSVLGYMAYAVTFSTQPVIAFYRRGRRWIEAGLGVFFTFAAYKLATYRS